MSDSENNHSHHGRRGRLFEAGRMKVLVLHLIQQSPKHGYEIMKEISEMVGGGYTPSAGTIYPTLNFLEDMGYVAVQQSEGDRKQYSLTETGAEHLQQQQDMIQQLLEKLQLRREIHSNERWMDIHRAMENLKTAMRLQLKRENLSQEQVHQIAEKIDQAAVEISRL